MSLEGEAAFLTTKGTKNTKVKFWFSRKKAQESQEYKEKNE